jgi:hypothetical protein
LTGCQGSSTDGAAGATGSEDSAALTTISAASDPKKPSESVPSSTAAVTSLPYPAPNVEGAPTATPQPYPYPAPLTATPNAEASGGLVVSNYVFLPFAGGSSQIADPPPAATPIPLPTVDFAAVQAELQARGKDLGFVKMGFHITLLEDREILDEWTSRLDQAGVPLFIKTVDNAEPLFLAQEMMKVSGVPHTLVYRSTGGEPYYEIAPELAAQVHWEEHRDKFPPELDPNLVWIETLNEPDRTKAEWFGQFALETARLAMADGFRWAAFSWASGEPEPEQWQTPSMLAFLQLVGENPERLAIALHEYSFLKEDLAHEYPYKVGRFQELFRIADERGFARPTVLITEWGWEHDNIPSVEQAMRDLEWASNMYAPYPQIKGAGIWNLGIGCCFGDISDQVQQIVEPLTLYSLTNYFEIPQPPEQQAIDPEQFRP